MTRSRRVCSILVVAILLALLVAPVAGARTVSSPSIHLADGGWLAAAFHWIEDLTGLNSHGHRPPSIHQKDITSTTNGGTCINPDGCLK